MSKNNTVINRDDLSVTMSREFSAERKRVWKVYTDPELIPRWWGPRYLTWLLTDVTQPANSEIEHSERNGAWFLR